MGSFAEEQLVSHLRSSLVNIEVGGGIPESPSFHNVMSALEYFIPECLREVHAEWEHESLDAVFPNLATKLAENEIEIVGTCIIISDQTIVPIHTQICISPVSNEAIFVRCKLGELINGIMNRVPYGNEWRYPFAVHSQLDSIQWAYHIEYGCDSLQQS